MTHRIRTVCGMSLLIACLMAMNGCSDAVSSANASPSAAQPTAKRPSPKPYTGGSAELHALIFRNFHKLKIGMTKKEAAATLGIEPSRSDQWSWEFQNTPMADLEYYRIEFKHGKLIDKSGGGIHYAQPY